MTFALGVLLTFGFLIALGYLERGKKKPEDPRILERQLEAINDRRERAVLAQKYLAESERFKAAERAKPPLFVAQDPRTLEYIREDGTRVSAPEVFMERPPPFRRLLP